jgi:hypothetical protein
LEGIAMRKSLRLCLAAAALLASASAALGETASVDAAADQAAIRKVISGTWGTPDAPVSIDPVVAAGDHAVAGWTWGERGGRALLARQNGAWVVVLCSGDSLKEADVLQQAGVPAGQASALADVLAEAEGKQPPARVKQFGSFEGTMRMDR